MSTTYILTLLLIGLFAGFLSGMVGIGGGIIIVPALVYFLNFSQHQAQGTSLGVLTFPVVLLGFISYYSELKNTEFSVSFKVIFFIAFTFIIGAYLGGQLAQKLNQDTLKKIFGILLLYLGLKFIGVEQYILKLIKPN